MKKKKMKAVSHDELIDKYIGKRGTPKRELFEQELKLDLIGEAIRETRLAQNLTQEQLGRRVGVQKAQISKLENGLKNARLETVIKVFQAMNATINFNVNIPGSKY